MIRIIFVIIALLSVGCVTSPPPQEQEALQKYWPKPPESPRFMHEATIRFIEDIAQKNDTQRLQEFLTGITQRSKAFVRPYDIASNFGRLYISDADAGLVSVFDVPRRRYYQIGTRLNGQLVKPMGLALDSRSNLYVADIASKRVQVFDFLGLHMNTLGRDDNLQQPMSVAVDSQGTVYVLDNGGIDSELHRVLVYDSTGQRIRTIGKRGHQPGEFNLPTDIAVTEDGVLYVLDSGNFRVQRFNQEGELIDYWGTPGNQYGQFARPRSIALDNHNRIYITDTFFGNFQVFDHEGRLLLPVGELSEIEKPGGYRLIAGISVDETDRVYVVDQFFKKVEVFKYLHTETVSMHKPPSLPD